MVNSSSNVNPYKDMAETARQSFNKNILEKRNQVYTQKPIINSHANHLNIKVKTIHKKYFNIILANKTPILPHKELDSLEDEINIKLPEMTFVNNSIKINFDNVYEYSINSLDCLNSVKREHNSEIQVVNSKHWVKHKTKSDFSDENALDPMLNFDWTYTPENYFGSVNILNENYCLNTLVEEESKIPFNKISLRVPIKHFSTILHFEDELNDNGVALLYSRIRIVDSKIPMSEKKIKYCYILTRFFLKVDKVISKVIDLRTYINLKKPSKINIQLDEYEKKLEENGIESDTSTNRINKIKSFEDLLKREHEILEDFAKVNEKSKYMTFVIDNI
ncbi:hypothetical protein QEN19_003302 [Hanseniaspora menglaensis]